MALEQFLAFLDDRPQEGLGSTTVVGPDRFPMLDTTDLVREHEHIHEMLEDVLRRRTHRHEEEVDPQFFQVGSDRRTSLYLALLERSFAFEARLGERDEEHLLDHFFGYGGLFEGMATLFEGGVDPSQVLRPTLRWLVARRTRYYCQRLLDRVLASLEADRSWLDDESIRHSLVGLRGNLIDGNGYASEGPVLDRIDDLLGDGVWLTVVPGERWTDRIVEQLRDLPSDETRKWMELLHHCLGAKSAKPSARWVKVGAERVAAVTPEAFVSHVTEWFGLIDRGKTLPTLCSVWESLDDRQTMHEQNANLARGLLWLCIPLAEADLCRLFRTVALSAYRKVRGIGPRAVKVGNAAVFVLGQTASLEAVGQLAILKVRVKFGTAQKGIEKALVHCAEQVGLDRDELEEMAVPAYGLTDVGVREETVGDFTARLAVGDPKCLLTWVKSDGKEQKSVPAAVKKDYADDLKELKQAAKDIDKMLPAQAARIEKLYLQPKSWPLSVWRERYLDHPLVGVWTRRLIWQFSRDGETASAIFYDGNFVDPHGRAVSWIDDGATVELWHPLTEEGGEDGIVAWRNWLIDHQVKQPFKQAHREIYLLTDAERSTGVYSNRFAAHILRQHQYNALCSSRGWKNALRLMVDDSYTASHIDLPHWSLRAEYWVEGVGDDYGVDTTESGAYLYLVTDQVRFYALGAAENYAHAGGGGFSSGGTDEPENQPRPLEEIPARVLSEVLRDVDLFVGVASVGNDPNWSDGGPEGRYLDYWQSYSFGELGATARTRQAVLARLIPQLKIADRCSVGDRFLVVRGDHRTYKIHLGSGNILMEPNDQYLCIVPGRSSRSKDQKLFLPFEGDGMLSVVLSKAFLLAADAKITDPTILSQIHDPALFVRTAVPATQLTRKRVWLMEMAFGEARTPAV